MTHKTDLIFLAFSSRFVDFAVQFCLRCKFSFNEERRSSQIAGLTVAQFFSTKHNSLLRTATNEIASFCIDHSGAPAARRATKRSPISIPYMEI